MEPLVGRTVADLPACRCSLAIVLQVDGTLVWSKKNGDGYCDSADKMQKVADAVEKAIAA